MAITHNHQPLTFQRRHKKKAKINLILYSPAVEAVSLSYTESKNHKKEKDCTKLSLSYPPITRTGFAIWQWKFFQNSAVLQMRASHLLKCLEKIKGLIKALFQLYPLE